MLQPIILILAVSEVFLIIPITLNYLHQAFFRDKLPLIKLFSVSLFCISFGLVFDNARLISSLTNGGFYGLLSDLYLFEVRGFIFCLLFTLIGTFILFEMVAKFAQKSGFQSRVFYVTRMISFLVIPIFTLITVFSITKTEPNDFGFYQIQIPDFLTPFFYLVYLPLGVFLVYSVRLSIARFGKSTANALRVFIIVLFITYFERLLNMDYVYQYGNSSYAVLFHILVRMGYCVTFFILCFIYPKFLEFVAVYFELKSVYLVTKGGVPLFKYEFEFLDREVFTGDDKSMMFGGFVQALASGLPVLVDEVGAVSAFQIRREDHNVNILIVHGEIIYGLLLVVETPPIMEEKLSMFVKTVEEKFQTELKNWDGRISVFSNSKDSIVDILTKVFR